MAGLSAVAGIPISLKGNRIVFGKGIKTIEPAARGLHGGTGMADVLAFPDKAKPMDFYYMYRDACLEKDRKILEGMGLRYDITVMPAFRVGGEYNKTYGHFHPKPAGSGISYPEVYEVLHGRAHYLLQSEKDVLLLEAKAGQKVLIPPGYGHVTINPGNKPLVMSNLVERNFKSDYSKYKSLRGAAYYETTEGLIKNPNYMKAPEIRKLKPKEIAEFGLTEGKPLYRAFLENPSGFSFLAKPQNYINLLENIY